MKKIYAAILIALCLYIFQFAYLTNKTAILDQESNLTTRD